MIDGESSDEEIETESPLDEIVAGVEFDNNVVEGACAPFPPSSLNLRDPTAQMISSGRSDTRYNIESYKQKEQDYDFAIGVQVKSI